MKEKVQFVRTKLCLTQSELAKKTGIPLSTIIKWENSSIKSPHLNNYGKFLKFCEGKHIFFGED